ncbi:MAG: serine/threonine-protein kinase [Polyangiaceae bacterium]
MKDPLDDIAPPDVQGSPELRRRRDLVRARLFEDRAAPRVGRFSLLRPLAEGAMGIVYVAYDEDLDRRVALKLLHPRPEDDEAMERWRREARALAKLRHPHVVAIYEVGEHEGQAFIAMELVEGRTLRAWLATSPPREVVVEVLRQAGRGLAAAHEAGLVHRDFKPDNVMVDAAGQARVLDFGLVLAAGESAAGAGTPAYMAPEQMAGNADPRSDQFAFAVVAWEALTGRHPFDERRPTAEVVAAGLEGRPEPRALAEILLRALRAEPADRWPSVAALVDALEATGRKRPHRWRAAALGLVVAGALSALALRERAPSCAEVAAAAAGAYDADPRLGATMEASGAPGWRDALAAVDAERARRRDAWQRMRQDLCVAQRRADLSETLHDLRRACLDARAAEWQALALALREDGAAAVRHGPSLAASLAPLDECADTASLLRLPAALQGVEAERAAALRGRILETWSRAMLGSVPARALLPLAKEAEALGHAPLTAEAWLRAADPLRRKGDYDEAERAIVTAYGVALRAGHDPHAARAAVQLVNLVGYHRRQRAAGEAWLESAEPLVARTQSAELAAALAHNRGMWLDASGRYDDAAASFEQALKRYETLFGADSLAVAGLLSDMSHADAMRGRPDEAIAELRRALAIRRRALGGNPLVADVMQNLGLALRAAGRLDEALRLHEEAHRLLMELLGSRDPRLANSLFNRGTSRWLAGDEDGGRADLEATVDLLDALGGGALLLTALETRAEMSPDAAAVWLERALRLHQAGDSPPADRARVACRLADALRVQGREEEAEGLYRDGIGATASAPASCRLGLAELLLANARREEAVSLLAGMDEPGPDLRPRLTALQTQLAE